MLLWDKKPRTPLTNKTPTDRDMFWLVIVKGLRSKEYSSTARIRYFYIANLIWCGMEVSHLTKLDTTYFDNKFPHKIAVKVTKKQWRFVAYCIGLSFLVQPWPPAENIYWHSLPIGYKSLDMAFRISPSVETQILVERAHFLFMFCCCPSCLRQKLPCWSGCNRNGKRVPST